MTFDEWRTRYDTMSFREHAAINDRWGVEYPAQASWKLQPVLDALWSARTVVEIGGWDGGLAAKALALLPRVERWTNYEMCQPAIDRTVCHDPRYKPVLLEDWPWNTDLEPADALVMSHVVEHMRFHQLFELTRLFDRYRVVHMQAPLDLERIDWTGYHGSHILEVGWLGVEALMRPWPVSGWGAVFRTWVAPETKENA